MILVNYPTMPKVLLLGLILWSTGVFALSIDDFVPDFLTAEKPVESSINPTTAFSIPETSKKRNSRKGSAWYCDRAHNVFCNKQDASKVLAQVIESNLVVGKDSTLGVDLSGTLGSSGNSGKYFNRNANSYDQNAVVNFNLTDSNQAALQMYSPKLNNYSTEQTLKNNVAVPIQADKNTSINIGQQQIEFNIKY